MLRTRPAGVAMIVVAALVSTSTAYLLATRTLDHAAPMDVEPFAALPGTATVEEHDEAVQATLLCLAAAGLMPFAEPARGKALTRITVDRQSLDLDATEAIIAECSAEANLRAVDADSGQSGVLLRATTSGQSSRASLQTCLPAAMTQEHGGDRRPICLDDIIATTGLQPLAAQQ